MTPIKFRLQQKQGRTMPHPCAFNKISGCDVIISNIGEFKDALSQAEYYISGLCQSCQDSFFGAPEGSEGD